VSPKTRHCRAIRLTVINKAPDCDAPFSPMLPHLSPVVSVTTRRRKPLTFNAIGRNTPKRQEKQSGNGEQHDYDSIDDDYIEDNDVDVDVERDDVDDKEEVSAYDSSDDGHSDVDLLEEGKFKGIAHLLYNFALNEVRH
jgi:hypothetical protein